MPISKMRHGESKGLFIVKTPNPITRRMYGVRFYEGEGRTKYAEKAKRFDEEFGYEIVPPIGFPEKDLWVINHEVAAGVPMEDMVEDGYHVELIDEDEEEEE